MFPRRKRLSRASLSTAQKVGRRAKSKHLSITLPRDVDGHAVIVSKKTARLSVTRHRIKRRVIAVLQSLHHLPPSVIVYPQASILKIGYDDLRQELLKLLS